MVMGGSDKENGSLIERNISGSGEKNQDKEQFANFGNLEPDKEALDMTINESRDVNISKKEDLEFAAQLNEMHISKVHENEQKYESTPSEMKQEDAIDVQIKDHVQPQKIEPVEATEKGSVAKRSEEGNNTVEDSGLSIKNMEEVSPQVEEEPVFDGTEIPEMEANRSLSPRSSNDSETQVLAWPDKAVALTKFVRQKSAIAVSSVLRRLSGNSDDGLDAADEDKREDHSSSSVNNPQEVSEKSSWNPLSMIGMSRDPNVENKSAKEGSEEDLIQPIAMKGRILLYTRLGCSECREIRRFLQGRRLKYIEINIDVYPSRKLELEKIAGSCSVPKVFFNEVLIGGLSVLKNLEESGKLQDKIEYVVNEAPSYEAPLAPLSGEDDLSSSGAIDELALIARKMKESIPIKDRFQKMRRYTNCFLGLEAVDFLSEDQYLEREEAVEFGRKLANKLFFQAVEEYLFEDGNHLYRFLDDDPLVSQCQNIPRGISEVKPKPITEISSRIRFLFQALLEAYASEDGKHVDYRSIHGSEEFARYLRTLEELQRVELHDMSREEKLSFFINLYNMMAIHAILVWGHPSGALERRKFFGDFKYVIGGDTYSLSAIYNGILRGNKRPPYNLTKPFGAKDKRLKVALGHTEPLVHFALVSGTRSGAALRCYSPGNIDTELMEAASNFLRSGGLYVDMQANIAYVSKILKWYSVDFGKNEVEVLKHAANYLEPTDTQSFLELLSNNTDQLKVIYQPYDWGLNH